MSDKMVPFGKHKGKPVEAILDDRPYVEWLLAQPWFKQNHTSLYTIVINNGHEPVDTPEHNAMQIRFLSEEFRLKFALAVKGESIFEFTSNAAVRSATAKATDIRDRLIAEIEQSAEEEYQKRVTGRSLASGCPVAPAGISSSSKSSLRLATTTRLCCAK